MGETASTEEGAANGDLAHLLAEAAAGRPGVQQRLAERLRPGLESLLGRRLAGGETASMADAGALVAQHWWQLAGSGEPSAESAAQRDTGRKAKPARKAAGGKARKGARSAKAGKEAEIPAPHAPGVEAAASPLFLAYVEQASQVMQGLVRDLAARSDPLGPASRTLGALEALDGLDPSLARLARLRWLAGLDDATIARLLGASEAEVQHRWLKARAFLAAATKGAATASA